MIPLPLQVLIFACLGVAMEVVFTAVMDFRKKRDARLLGYSYIWMLPIYGLVPLCLAALKPWLGDWPGAARIAAYTGAILLAEWIFGWTLRLAVGEAPWEPEYRGKRWAVQDLVRLDYAPAWALACLFFERVWLALN